MGKQLCILNHTHMQIQQHLHVPSAEPNKHISETQASGWCQLMHSVFLNSSTALSSTITYMKKMFTVVTELIGLPLFHLTALAA